MPGIGGSIAFSSSSAAAMSSSLMEAKMPTVSESFFSSFIAVAVEIAPLVIA